MAIKKISEFDDLPSELAAGDDALIERGGVGYKKDGAGFVVTTGDQTIAGIKTFSSSPIVPAPTTDMQAATRKFVLDNAGVGLTGDQTIAGIKTFSSSPIVPTPTTDMQAATKKYVDDSLKDWTSYNPFDGSYGTNTQGFGTATSITCYYLIIGKVMHLMLKFTTGTTTSSEARVALPASKTTISGVSSAMPVGRWTNTITASSEGNVLVKPSVGYVNFGVQGAANGGLTVVNGTSLNSSTTYGFYATVPIQ